MFVFHTVRELQDYLNAQRSASKTIGFVPTMGALHEGHLQLIRKAGSENDVMVVSIFVNPIQFNNPEDLEKYPRTLEKDIELLKTTPCSVVFAPPVAEMYPEPVTEVMTFGGLEQVMEGYFRPGHFSGVGIVVKKLLEIVAPDRAYFGEKDFQQLAILKYMVRSQQLPVEIVDCPIVREADGLAMSSRNTRLTPVERKVAPAIYQALHSAKLQYVSHSPEDLKKKIWEDITKEPLLKPEYVEIVDTETLKPIAKWDDAPHAIVCVAVFLGSVRLIDNIVLY